MKATGRPRWAPLLLAAAMVLAGCGGQQSGAVQPSGASRPQEASAAASLPTTLPEDDALGYSVLCTLPNMNSNAMTQLARGVQDRADELGLNIEMHNSHDDHMGQATRIDEFVTGGGQALICAAVDAGALQPFLEHAQAQGVKVAVYGGARPADAGLSASPYQAGLLLGRDAAGAYITKELAGEGEVGLLRPQSPDDAQRAFFEGVEAGLRESAPEAVVLSQAMADGQTGGDAILALLEEAPDVRVVLAGEDDVALSALDALLYHLTVTAREAAGEGAEEQEIDTSMWFFGGYGASEDGLAAIAGGGAFRASISLCAYQSGQELVDQAVVLVQGGEGTFAEMPPEVVDRRNADGYNG